ncbi:MAG: sigma-70 family RNA polymerase sigma factor [Henriciella sp.]|nr:sigma-70 family RNA polymerase sigma factor [Henriciella sp.]
MSPSSDIHKLLDETIRRERGWLISSLVSRLGPGKVDLAEDVAQDAIVKALATWPYKGVPDNPRAWLRRVAGNTAIDRIRRSARELGIDDDWDLASEESDIITPSLSDPELDLMVLCCDPALAPQDQLFLALKTVCGFTAAETAALFFLKEDALSQRLARAKRQLRNQSGELARFPTRFALKDRLPQLLKMIYLMFSWGYLPRRGDVLFREDVCREAIRLSESLLAQTDGQTAGHHALHALLLFQTARFPARAGPDGSLLTLEQQDRTKWDQEMIFDGFAQLQAAQSSPSLTRYHLEAGIASVHAQARTWQGTDWPAIVQLYSLLNQQAPSLAVSVNLAVSLIYAGEISSAQTQLDKAETLAAAQDLPGYHLARAKLARAQGNGSKAQAALKRAAACRISAPIDEHIARQAALIDIEA